MKKTAILAMAVATMLTTSIGFASPLTDYSTGKTSVDLTWRQTALDLSGPEFGHDSLNKKGNFDFGITTGLGHNFAFQYVYNNGKSKVTTFPDGTDTYTESASLRANEFNVLYKLDKNVSVYTGIVAIKGNITADPDSASSSKNRLQFGVIGSTKLADKTTAYAQVGVASQFYNWKIGVSQEIAPNLEFNLDYGRMQASKMRFNNGAISENIDMTSKGLGIGVGYKF